MNVAVLGGGAMGHVLAQMIEEKDGFALAGMVDPLKGESLADLDDVDVVIDFSNPANLPMVMAYCEENKCPAVIATTGFSDEETAKIQALGQEVPVVFSANYSLGINVMKRVVAEITPTSRSSKSIITRSWMHRVERLRCCCRQQIRTVPMIMCTEEKETARGARKSVSMLFAQAPSQGSTPCCMPVTTNCWRSSTLPDPRRSSRQAR